MNEKRAMCLRSNITRICIWSCLAQLSAAAPSQQEDFFDQAAASALGVAMQVAEFFQNGAALRKNLDFQLPGVGMHSKTEFGMGEAIIRRSDSSEEDSDEYRRKRSADSDELSAGPRTSFMQIMRKVNAPCHAGGGATDGGGANGDGDEIIDEARRRMARMRARKAAAAKKAKKSTNSKTKSGRRRRRRRQTEIDDLVDVDESERAELENAFRTHMQQFTEQINRVYENIAATVMDLMKRMDESFNADDDGE
ncbi:uncharacterized protein LOC128857191 [Anastrepha ludens]|uniref:uncharacterized protein LOC128857191 n=1 Tax=Anastrepha ludens TaxID=28586 RepID=UPI0023AF19FB|nr:uncharacterized protein LOC128857191 [Anastrepha ludens]